MKRFNFRAILTVFVLLIFSISTVVEASPAHKDFHIQGTKIYKDFDIQETNSKLIEAKNNIRNNDLNAAKEILEEIKIAYAIVNLNNEIFNNTYKNELSTLLNDYNKSDQTISEYLQNIGDTYKDNFDKREKKLKEINTKLSDSNVTKLINNSNLTKLKSDINSLMNLNQELKEEYNGIKSIKEESDAISPLLTSLINNEKFMNEKFMNDSNFNYSAINKISVNYKNTWDNYFKDYSIIIFSEGKENWVKNRYEFFKNFHNTLEDISNLEKDELSETKSKDDILSDLKTLSSEVNSLKLNYHQKLILENEINTQKTKVENIGDPWPVILLIIAIIIVILTILFVLYYIFFLSNNKGPRPIKDRTISRYLDGRTFLVFNSNKYGTLFHPKKLEFYANSDVGLKRELNEDSIGVTLNKDGSRVLFVLADGMGGHNAGEIASKIAIQTAIEGGKKELLNAQNLTGSDIKDILRDIVYSAHENILNMAKYNPEMSNMGTTLEIVFLNGNHLYYAHVGDSRVYMTYRDDNSEERIERVTKDHSELGMYMERYGVTEAEARTKVASNVITQAVGITSVPLNPDIGDFLIGINNWILICSDGLTDMVQDDSYIGKILIHEKLQVKEKVNELIRAAKEFGGKDNISIIIFKRR
ncbi:MAG: putative protein phosphatase 2C-type [Firmicutes bacterium ADurb.Bin080]|nr:MAG: putative protein phosphatase 2C-type [Firmicutes bacterium ADurb.Bin080]